MPNLRVAMPNSRGAKPPLPPLDTGLCVHRIQMIYAGQLQSLLNVNILVYFLTPTDAMASTAAFTQFC